MRTLLGMSEVRYKELFNSIDAKLTDDEIAAGWHWCEDFDGLPVGPGMDELNSCHCLPSGHTVYKTAPPVATSALAFADIP